MDVIQIEIETKTIFRINEDFSVEKLNCNMGR